MNIMRTKKLALRLRHLLLAAVALVLVLAGLIVAKIWSDSRMMTLPTSVLSADKVQVSRKLLDGSVRETLEIQVPSGAKIPARFYYPASRQSAVGCVVLLYGIGQKLEFADSIADQFTASGYALFCSEQLGQGARRPERGPGWKRLTLLRRRAAATVAETKWFADYLVDRKEVDQNRLYLLGISWGAIVGTSALALEPRYQAGILMWGGGDVDRIFRVRTPSAKSTWVERAGMRVQPWLLAPVEPLDWVTRISPRPLLFQNARFDEIIPAACSRSLFEKARAPKSILWYDCGHEKGVTREMVSRIIDDQLRWLDRLGK